MTVYEALSGVSLLYVDTAPFIYYTENRSGYVEKMRSVFGEIDQGRLRAATCAVTLVETLTKPLQMDDWELVNRYRVMFGRTRGITVFPSVQKSAILPLKFGRDMD